jgi:chromosome segregation ATPase
VNPHGGPDAFRELARDTLSPRCALEVRSYTYHNSKISVAQLTRSRPTCVLDESYDPVAAIDEVKSEETRRIVEEDAARSSEMERERQSQLQQESVHLHEDETAAKLQTEAMRSMTRELEDLRLQGTAMVQKLMAGPNIAERRARLAEAWREMERRRGELDAMAVQLDREKAELAGRLDKLDKTRDALVAVKSAAENSRQALEGEKKRIQEMWASLNQESGRLTAGKNAGRGRGRSRS